MSTSLFRALELRTHWLLLCRHVPQWVAKQIARRKCAKSGRRRERLASASPTHRRLPARARRAFGAFARERVRGARRGATGAGGGSGGRERERERGEVLLHGWYGVFRLAIGVGYPRAWKVSIAGDVARKIAKRAIPLRVSRQPFRKCKRTFFHRDAPLYCAVDCVDSFGHHPSQCRPLLSSRSLSTSKPILSNHARAASIDVGSLR